MLTELAHVLRHAPATLALKRRLPQHELYDTLIARADAAGLATRRDELVRGLRGDIVEIGCGTGAMFRVGMLVFAGSALAGCGKKISSADHERCGTFAERVASCALASEHFGPLPEPDRTNVRTKAYEVCTGTSTEATAIKWYGDVAAKAECAKLQGNCRAFQDCMDAIDARAGSNTR